MTSPDAAAIHGKATAPDATGLNDADASPTAQRPRVLFLDQSGQLGGAELCLLDVVTRLRCGATVCTFADGPFPRRLRAAGVRATVLGANLRGGSKSAGPMAWLAAAGGMAKLAVRLLPHARRADVIYANTLKALPLGAAVARLTRRPLVFHLHDLLSAEHFSRANRALVVRLANACAVRVIANSHATAAAFAHAGGDARRVTVIYNGIDAAAFDAVDDAALAAAREAILRGGGDVSSDPPPAGAGFARTGFAGAGVAEKQVAPRAVVMGDGRSADVPVIGLFGRFAPWKGQFVALEALARLPGVRLALVGDALFGETAYRDELLSRIDALGLTSRVTLLGFRDDVPALMKACDVVIHCSTAAEPFGRVIVEAQLAGTPVIATDAGGAREIVRHGETGLLVPPADAAALATAVRSLLDDPARASRLAATGRASARENFTLDAVVRATETLLNKAWRSGRARGRHGG